MIDYIDSRGYPCARIDACAAPANEQEAYNLLKTVPIGHHFLCLWTHPGSTTNSLLCKVCCILN